MTIDDWMPVSASIARERHATEIRAPAPVVYQALWRADCGGALTRVLLAIRLLPALLGDWRRTRDRLARRRAEGDRITLQTFLASGFARLEERPGEELLLGLTGRFWTPSGGLVETRPEVFRSGPPAGHAQAAWSFRCVPTPSGGTHLSTETRVRIGPGAARARFRAYWFVVRPFSGLLRRMMLRAIRLEAEGVLRHSEGHRR